MIVFKMINFGIFWHFDRKRVYYFLNYELKIDNKKFVLLKEQIIK